MQLEAHREPRLGDKVWYQPRHKLNQKQPNGILEAFIRDDEEVVEAVVLFMDGEQEIIDINEFDGKWTDKYGGIWEITS